MGADLLGSLASFLRTLAAAPHPDEVAAAFVRCFADSLGTRTVAIVAARPPLLVVYALAGYEPQEVDGFSSMHLADDYPSTRAVREGEVIVEPIGDLLTSYTGAGRPSSRSRHLVQRIPEGWSVSAPLISAGGVTGALTMVCAGARPWTTWDSAAVSAAGAALGMWLSHPDSGLPSTDPRDRPVLTPRQRRILSLAALGRTTSAIGMSLGYSESTVKQELQRTMRVLGVDSRGAAVERARTLDLLDGSGG